MKNVAIIAVVLVVSLAVVGAGCDNADEPTTTTETTTETTEVSTGPDLTVSEAVEKLKAGDFEIGTEVPVGSASAINSEEGTKLQVDSYVVEIYAFADDEATKVGIEKLGNFSMGETFEQNGLVYYVTTDDADFISKVKKALQ
ncbi:hypothetical protein ACFL2B_00290 [Patescibacteria group bacterium]